MAPLPEEKLNQNDNATSSKSNGDYASELSGASQSPPAFQLKAGSGNSQYDEFLENIDPKDNLRSEMFAGVSILEDVYDNSSILKMGASGDHILRIRQILHRSGYIEKSSSTLKFDETFKSGLQALQSSSNAILEDGIVGPETMRLLDSKALYLERDEGECPADPKENIEKAKEKFAKEKEEEDKKWFFDDTKSDMPEIQLKIVNLYEKYSSGNAVNERYISNKAKKMLIDLKAYILRNGTIEEIAGEKNPYFQPISDIETSAFQRLDAISDPDAFIVAVEDLAKEIQKTISLIRYYTSWPRGAAYPSGGELFDHITKRSENPNDIYSAFI